MVKTVNLKAVDEGISKLFQPDKYFIYLKRKEDIVVKEADGKTTLILPLCTYDPKREPEEPHAYCQKEGIKITYEKGVLGPIEISIKAPE